MDPLTAIGLVSSIVGLVSLGTNIVQGAMEIHDSLDGIDKENRTRRNVVEDLQRLQTELMTPRGVHGTASGTDEGLCVLAEECHVISGDLIRLLEKAKPSDKSKRQSLWAALKSSYYKKDVEDVEKRLENCRGQLGVHLQVVARAGQIQTANDMQKLFDLVKATAARFDDLQGKLGQGVEVLGLSEEAQAQLKRLLSLPEKMLEDAAAQRIINGLYFDGIWERQDSVPESHADTFQWLMYGENAATGSERETAHRTFKKWMESESGVFHICGKLGSGKSTLMKFLGAHAEENLQAWSGERTLVFARCFFWGPGTQLQKSLRGLHRTLLYDVLKRRPEFVPEAFPAAWNKIKSLPLEAQDRVDVNEREITSALMRLLVGGGKAVRERHCFCFFIDGLDEFEETAGSTHKDLVKTLNGWATAGSLLNSVKLCVSSRPHNIFLNAFSGERRLHLHDVTRLDMEMYVGDRLQDISGLEGHEKLVGEIVDKAEGVFQWVALVVKRMEDEIEDKRPGIDGGYVRDTADFSQLLGQLPHEIDALYKRILTGVRRPQLAYRTLATLLRATQINLSLSVDAYSYLGTYKPGASDIRDNASLKATELDTPGASARTLYAKSWLRGVCGGLLETGPHKSSNNTIRELVLYTHRSIPDFLQRHDLQLEMAQHLAGFDQLDAISQMYIAEIRMFRGCDISRPAVLYHLLEARYEARIDAPPYAFLEALDGEESATVGGPHSLTYLLIPDPSCGKSFELWVPTNRDDHFCLAEEISSVDPDHFSKRQLDRPLFWATWAGVSGYLLWKMKQQPNLTDNLDKVALFAYAILERQRIAEAQDAGADLAVLEFLIGQGLLVQRTRLQFKIERSYRRLEGPSSSSMLTVWQHYLQSEWLRQHDFYSYETYHEISGREHDARFARTVAWFVRNGAEPGFSVHIEVIDQKAGRWDEWMVSIQFQDAKKAAARSTEGYWIPKPRLGRKGSAQRDWQAYSCLADWVRNLPVGTPAREEALQLLDARSASREIAHRDVTEPLASPHPTAVQTASIIILTVAIVVATSKLYTTVFARKS